MIRPDYDAVVVGSGPNGLAAAIALQQAGQRVLLIEGKSTIGGGMRTAELTLPGFHHDICSAVHPLAVNSPFFSKLPLDKFGLEWIYPPLAAAHPLDNGEAALLSPALEQTAAGLGKDEQAYLNLVRPVLNNWPEILPDILGPFGVPRFPLKLAGFGIKALASAASLSARFETTAARALWAGMAAHSMMPITNAATAAIALVLVTTAHHKGWPIPKSGSQSLANALGAYFESIGGTIQTNMHIYSLDQLPAWKALLLDITPRQLIQIAGYRFSPLYKWQLSRYRYGMGVFKIDWALDGPIPWKTDACAKAGTVHLGNSFEEIARSEQQTMNGEYVEKPFVLLSQQSLFDNTRAPEGKHTAWAYCHVPHGSRKDLTENIEKQVERFAPGFRDRILARHTMNAEDLERYNPNYVGGDINGGIQDLGQLFTRPALRFSPYRTSAKGIYICSSATPPGGGVHGMCGFHAAQRALKDVLT